MDVLTPAQRRRNMQHIRGRDTRPEKTVRSFLFRQGFRYRLKTTVCGIRPDVVLRKYRTVIFVHGCFWHRHEGCRLAVVPSTNTEFWMSKFQKNMERDARQVRMLIKDGWRVCIVWECTLKNEETLSELTDNIRDENGPVLWESGIRKD